MLVILDDRRSYPWRVLAVDPHERIGDLRVRLAIPGLTGFADDDSLGGMRIQALSILTVPKEPGEIGIVAEKTEMDHLTSTWTNAPRRYLVHIQRNAAVMDLMRLLEAVTGVPAQEQRLMASGRYLERGQKLADYNIQDGSTVNMSFRLRG
jgi:hypothetical protein